MEDNTESLYIHVDNGGIDVEVGTSEYGDHFIKISTQYHAYPYGEFTSGALNTEQCTKMANFSANKATKLKLKE